MNSFGPSLREVINRAWFDAGTSSNFGGVKAHRRKGTHIRRKLRFTVLMSMNFRHFFVS